MKNKIVNFFLLVLSVFLTRWFYVWGVLKALKTFDTELKAKNLKVEESHPLYIRFEDVPQNHHNEVYEKFGFMTYNKKTFDELYYRSFSALEKFETDGFYMYQFRKSEIISDGVVVSENDYIFNKTVFSVLKMMDKLEMKGISEDQKYQLAYYLGTMMELHDTKDQIDLVSEKKKKDFVGSPRRTLLAIGSITESYLKAIPLLFIIPKTLIGLWLLSITIDIGMKITYGDNKFSFVKYVRNLVDFEQIHRKKLYNPSAVEIMLLNRILPTMVNIKDYSPLLPEMSNSNVADIKCVYQDSDVHMMFEINECGNTHYTFIQKIVSMLTFKSAL